MIFSASQVDRLNRGCPMLAGVKLGDKLAEVEKGALGSGLYFPVAIVCDVTTGAADIKIFDADAPFAFELADVIVQPRGASVNGTVKITDGTSDITDAMVCAVDQTMARAGTIDDSKASIAEGGTLQIVCAGDAVANTKALVTILALRKS